MRVHTVLQLHARLLEHQQPTVILLVLLSGGLGLVVWLGGQCGGWGVVSWGRGTIAGRSGRPVVVKRVLRPPPASALLGQQAMGGLGLADGRERSWGKALQVKELRRVHGPVIHRRLVLVQDAHGLTHGRVGAEEGWWGIAIGRVTGVDPQLACAVGDDHHVRGAVRRLSAETDTGVLQAHVIVTVAEGTVGAVLGQRGGGGRRSEGGGGGVGAARGGARPGVRGLGATGLVGAKAQRLAIVIPGLAIHRHDAAGLGRGEGRLGA
jgi:hypothetical protein